jgi:hypothetical protein
MYIGGKMSETMTRKQLYLPQRLNQFLKRAARQRGISESEVMRQALEREAEISTPTVRDSQKAWEEIVAYIETYRKKPEMMHGKPYVFNREELYEERENRWTKPKEGK